MDSDQGNSYVSVLSNKIMNGVDPLCLITNLPSKFKPRLQGFFTGMAASSLVLFTLLT